MTWFCREKKDASTQVDCHDFPDRNGTLPTPVQDTNPFANMSINPYSDTEGLFPNPLLGCELMEGLQNPFLDKNEKLLLINTGETWIPLISSNPFFDYCVADASTYILNPSDDPMKNVPQSPMDYMTHCQEWVQKHREYHVKKLRSLSI
ncbi:hypothetical protein AVEN_232803-1 [Araneus ventricosus]|uniref:Uncharacterized protein n=1 Tax=Araneus ventricosus TaxID=182803 RepID=A0A4Y2QUP1_ARAVE|nr:hypothetical protein AVEN_3455-1 [Araneus ventricosus]GBN67087.1 hypothetical protein AVEN_232803-1 [Araneus ventricosus]